MALFSVRLWGCCGWYVDKNNWNALKIEGWQAGRIGSGFLIYTYQNGFDLIFRIQPREFVLGYRSRKEQTC